MPLRKLRLQGVAATWVDERFLLDAFVKQEQTPFNYLFHQLDLHVLSKSYGKSQTSQYAGPKGC
jgi:hypothetical protein